MALTPTWSSRGSKPLEIDPQALKESICLITTESPALKGGDGVYKHSMALIIFGGALWLLVMGESDLLPVLKGEAFSCNAYKCVYIYRSKLCGGGGLGFYQGLYIRYNSARWRANSRCSFNR